MFTVVTTESEDKKIIIKKNDSYGKPKNKNLFWLKHFLPHTFNLIRKKIIRK